MSLQIIKSGILDTIQDVGRYGYQHLGINPGGAMDVFSAQLSNALLGKDLQAPVIELHFPASQILFEKETIICLTGADFSPMINQKIIPSNQPIIINKNNVLQFTKTGTGARCYLSIFNGFKIGKWMNSFSTNTKAGAGGWHGRALQKGDILGYENRIECKHLILDKDFLLLPWKVERELKNKNEIRIIPGNEWDWLSDDAKKHFTEGHYQISNNADRMGYQLTGKALNLKKNRELVSSAVAYGTIQLLPGGQLIVLMADHQTTGGYPRIANVISADLPMLAQKIPGDKIIFLVIDIPLAETALMTQQEYLRQLQAASKFKIEKLLHVSL